MGEWTLFCFPSCFHGCPEDSHTSTFHQDLPGFGQCLSFCWLLPSSISFSFPYRFSLWGSLILSLKPWWVEPVSKRPELAFLVPFNPPSGEGESRPFLLLSPYIASAPLPHFGSSSRCHIPIPKLEEPSRCCLLKLLSPGLRGKVDSHHSTHLGEARNQSISEESAPQNPPSLSTVLNLLISSLWTSEPARSTS